MDWANTLFSLETWEHILQEAGFLVQKRVQRLAGGELDIFCLQEINEGISGKLEIWRKYAHGVLA
jgi:hypothetical protein